MGGLGIRSIFRFAKAALRRQVWNIVINKQTCWNIWINARYLKGIPFWDISVLTNASWGWKCIIALRPYALPHIKLLIGNGRLTQFWTNPWLSGGRLKDQYGDRAIYDLGMGANIRVNRFLHDVCHLPHPRSTTLMDIFQKIPSEIVLWHMFYDEIIWTLEEHCQFYLKSSYRLMCNIPN